MYVVVFIGREIYHARFSVHETNCRPSVTRDDWDDRDGIVPLSLQPPIEIYHVLYVNACNGYTNVKIGAGNRPPSGVKINESISHSQSGQKTGLAVSTFC